MCLSPGGVSSGRDVEVAFFALYYTVHMQCILVYSTPGGTAKLSDCAHRFMKSPITPLVRYTGAQKSAEFVVRQGAPHIVFFARHSSFHPALDFLSPIK